MAKFPLQVVNAGLFFSMHLPSHLLFCLLSAELKQVMDELGLTVSKDEFDILFRTLDTNNDQVGIPPL